MRGIRSRERVSTNDFRSSRPVRAARRSRGCRALGDRRPRRGVGQSGRRRHGGGAAAPLETDENTLYIGGSLFLLGALFFLWFMGSLREALLLAEGGVGRVTSIATAGAIATAIFAAGVVIPQIGGAFAANETDAPLEPAAAQALWYAGDGAFVAAEYSVALLFIASAVVALRTRVLPVWLAWLSIVMAIVALIPPIGWATLIFGFPLWVIVVSVLLIMRERPRTEPGAAPPPG